MMKPVMRIDRSDACPAEEPRRSTVRRNAAAFVPVADDVFARLAGRYDRLCDLFSLGAHRLWKARMAATIVASPGSVVLDVASGTGDIPLRVLRRLRHAGPSRLKKILVTDLCPEMLAVAGRKMRANDVSAEIALADAHHLEGFPAESVDVYTIAFAMKICDRERVLAEAFRVLKPGGAFLCLEAARIPVGWVQGAYLAYMRACLPLIGRLAAGRDPAVYDYLLRGLQAFPAQADFAVEIEQAGFRDATFENLTFGIVALHRAIKP